MSVPRKICLFAGPLSHADDLVVLREQSSILYLLSVAPAACKAFKGINQNDLYLRVTCRFEPKQQFSSFGIISNSATHPKKHHPMLYQSSNNVLCFFKNSRQVFLRDYSVACKATGSLS